MNTYSFPYSKRFLEIRRIAAPKAKWIGATKEWQMSDAEANAVRVALKAEIDRVLKIVGSDLNARSFHGGKTGQDVLDELTPCMAVLGMDPPNIEKPAENTGWTEVTLGTNEVLVSGGKVKLQTI